MSNLVEHAKRELQLAGYFDPNGIYGDMLGKAVMELITVFANQGHSGMSAPAGIGLFQTLASFEPIMPLTGEQDEWNYIGDDTWQNIRCSHVFKTPDEIYDIRGKVFIDDDGTTYTNKDSRVNISFPYTPTVEYVKIHNTNTGKKEC